MNKTSIVVGVVLVAALTSTGAQAADPAVRCEVAKMRQVARHSKCMLQTFARTIEREEDVLTDRARCEVRLGHRLIRVHNKYEGYCANNNDYSLLHVLTLSYAHQIAFQLRGE